jgi:hypothetical protein
MDRVGKKFKGSNCDAATVRRFVKRKCPADYADAAEKRCISISDICVICGQINY